MHPPALLRSFTIRSRMRGTVLMHEKRRHEKRRHEKQMVINPPDSISARSFSSPRSLRSTRITGNRQVRTP